MMFWKGHTLSKWTRRVLFICATLLLIIGIYFGWEWIYRHGSFIVTAIAGILVIIGGYVAGHAEEGIALEQRKRRVRRSQFIGAVAGILAIVAGFLAGLESDRASARLDAKNDEIIELQRQNLDFFTGGSSICYFAFQQTTDGPAAVLSVLGKNPVRDFMVTITNLTLLEELKAKSPNLPLKELREKTVHDFPFQAIWPNTNNELNIFPYPETGDANFVIGVHQVMGQEYVELASMRRVSVGLTSTPDKPGPLLVAYRVFRVLDQGASTLAELANKVRHIDPGFPLDERGKVPWLDYPDQWGLNYRLSGELEPQRSELSGK